MEIKYENFVSYKEMKEISQEQLTRLKQLARKEKEILGKHGSNYYFSTSATDFPELVKRAYQRLYVKVFYYENTSRVDRALILANVAFEDTDRFISFLNQKFPRETLVALIDLIEYIRKARLLGKKESQIKEYEEKVRKCIIPIRSHFAKYSGNLPVEAIINKISEVIAFESDKLLSRTERKNLESTKNTNQEEHSSSSETSKHANKQFKELNKLIKSKLENDEDIELVFTSLCEINGQPAIDCTCVYRSEDESPIENEKLTRLITPITEITQSAKSLGISFYYTLISSIEFKRTFNKTNETGDILYDDEGKPIGNDEALKRIAASTLLICRDRKYLKRFDSIKNISRRLTKQNPK